MEARPNTPERVAPRVSATWGALPFQPHDTGRAQWEAAGRERRIIIITKIPLAQTCEQAERRLCRILAKHEIVSPVFYCSQNRTIGEHSKHHHDGWLYAAFPDPQIASIAVVKLHGTSLPNGERLCVSKVMPSREDTAAPASQTSTVLGAAADKLATMQSATPAFGYFIPGAFGSGEASRGQDQPVPPARPSTPIGGQAYQAQRQLVPPARPSTPVGEQAANRQRSLSELQADYEAICHALSF